MARMSFSRDELLMALHTVAQILQAFPNVQYPVEDFHAPTTVIERSLADASLASAGTGPQDGAPGKIEFGYGKGLNQPPRKRHMLSPKIKQLDRVDWEGVPRAARRIAEELSTHGPATSHELMLKLQIARPTFNNAISKLRKKRLVASENLRGGHVGAQR